MLCIGSDLDKALAVGISVGVSRLTKDGDAGFSYIGFKKSVDITLPSGNYS